MSAHMWRYWVDDEGGVVDAMRRHYPKTARGDLVIAAALAQIEMAELAINARMQQYEDNEVEPGDDYREELECD